MATPSQSVSFLSERKQDIRNMFNDPGSEDAHRAANSIFDAHLIGLLCAMVTEQQWHECVLRAFNMTKGFMDRNFAGQLAKQNKATLQAKPDLLANVNTSRVQLSLGQGDSPFPVSMALSAWSQPPASGR